ncbi:MAG TPA: cobalamin-dependent protein [Thermodesulfobacteriota bacterium]|nr:cobalamin-dependent protein [Thermodesulfobacteriota bacterium]
MTHKLVDALSSLQEDKVLAEVITLKERNVPIFDIIQLLQEGMSLVGKRFEAGEYFLSELIMSSSIFKEAVNALGEDFDQGSLKYGTLVIGTIFGDVHDIGKNIVANILRCNGFRVIDLGVNVPIQTFVKAIRDQKPDLLGISCLLTTGFDHMRSAIKEIEDAGLRKDLKILIGGGPVTQATCNYVRADGFGPNAQEAVELSQKMLKGRRNG